MFVLNQCFTLFRSVLCGIKSLEFYTSVLPRTNAYEIFGDQICDGGGFTPSTSVFPSHYHSSFAPYSS